LVWIGRLILVFSALGGPPDVPPPAQPPAGVPSPTANLLDQQAEAAPLSCETAWRRTRDGWELPSRWPSQRMVGANPPALHPIVVGSMELLLALTALLAFPCKALPQRRQIPA
jgi:hypothetical protein